MADLLKTAAVLISTAAPAGWPATTDIARVYHRLLPPSALVMAAVLIPLYVW